MAGAVESPQAAVNAKAAIAARKNEREVIERCPIR
jgi:hypothetical protein